MSRRAVGDEMGGDACEHSWEFGGLKYHHADWPMAGTGARTRYYEDWFYCTRCLANRYESKRAQGNSYENPIAGAIPR